MLIKILTITDKQVGTYKLTVIIHLPYKINLFNTNYYPRSITINRAFKDFFI